MNPAIAPPRNQDDVGAGPLISGFRDREPANRNGHIAIPLRTDRVADDRSHSLGADRSHLSARRAFGPAFPGR